MAQFRAFLAMQNRALGATETIPGTVQGLLAAASQLVEKLAPGCVAD